MIFSLIQNTKITVLVLLFMLMQTSLFAMTEVAIIDTGLSKQGFIDFKDKLCTTGHKDFTNKGIEDIDGHGTNLASIIYPHLIATKECIVVLKVYISRRSSNPGLVPNLIRALEYARLKNYKYINYSISGLGEQQRELRAIKSLIQNKQYFVVAAGNDGMDLSKYCYYFPVCYPIKSKYFYKVGAIKRKKRERYSMSNYNGPINMVAIGEGYCYNGDCMSGTSQATARVTAFLVKRNRNEKK